MAVIGCSYSVSAPIIIQKSDPRKKPVRSTVVMSADNHISLNNTTPFQVIIRLPARNKVFEDQSKGIVCYREENGEITCEGIDEGPRFHHPSSRFTFTNTHRKGEIIDQLEKNLLQMVERDRFN
ncbi:hypothetical protein ACH5RR_007865 [Cinchona calisaya]|uniref:Uncharacterized protein n=1 Tax=Cinchona calisaya TaxID=153742 RepID=A0ABD3AFU8_9GENT